MARLKLINVDLPYKKIMKGQKWIGRVYKNAQGGYTGLIGKGTSAIEATGATEREAFEEVGARYFGQPSAAALRQHNAEAQSANRASRARSRAIAEDMMSGDNRRFMDALDRLIGGDPSARRRRLN